MNFLEFGMANKTSTSSVKRFAAKMALTLEKKWADLYAYYLERIPMSFPEEDAEQMLGRLREGAASLLK